MRHFIPTKRRGPLALDDGVQRIYVECHAAAGGCGRTISLYRDRAGLRAARRAFRQHARRCPCVPSRWPRRLTATAFVLALAAVAFAATVAGLSSLAVPAPATPTTATAPGYVPVPAGPPPAEGQPGGGR